MAKLEDTSAFDPDALGGAVVGVACELRGHDSGVHMHRRGQLLWARQGCIRITLESRLCLLPPSRAAWIPPGTPHRARMTNVVDYRSLWFDEALSTRLPMDVRVIDVGPLLGAVIEPLALAAFDEDWSRDRNQHLVGLSVHEIREAPTQPMLLPMPQDRRLAVLRDNPDRLPPELQELAQHVGATEKTIGRIFLRQTGMSYQPWRQQWRVIRATELLALRHPVSFVAGELGFASDSAFIAFFRQMLGCTPGAFFRR